jgi:hypothetical protein
LKINKCPKEDKKTMTYNGRRIEFLKTGINTGFYFRVYTQKNKNRENKQEASLLFGESVFFPEG